MLFRSGSYGSKLLNRQAEEFAGLMPIMEFDTLGAEDNSPFEQFPEIPAELLIDNDPLDSPPSQSFGSYSDDENVPSETREISLEEFSAMLHKDPSLVAELAEQFGIQTSDPQEIIDIVVAQMQQQIQPPSGDLTPVVSSATLTDQNQPASEQIQTEDSTPKMVSEPSRTEPKSPLPPPPPAPKLEYKPEDPWSADRATNQSEELLPEAVNMPDRGV